MSKVHKLGLVPQPRAEEQRRLESIKLLEDALAKAKSGEVSEALVILRHPDGGHTAMMARTEDTAGWLGYLEMLKFQWLQSETDLGKFDDDEGLPDDDDED